MTLLEAEHLEAENIVINVAMPRFMRSIYRKEPISGFIFTIGVVDALMGGFQESFSLMALGVGTVGLAVGLRWWLIQRSRIKLPETVAEYYLPPASSRPQLPTLTTTKRRSPRH